MEEEKKDKKEALQEILREIAENLDSVEKITITFRPRKILQGKDKET